MGLVVCEETDSEERVCSAQLDLFFHHDTSLATSAAISTPNALSTVSP